MSEHTTTDQTPNHDPAACPDPTTCLAATSCMPRSRWTQAEVDAFPVGTRVDLAPGITALRAHEAPNGWTIHEDDRPGLPNSTIKAERVRGVYLPADRTPPPHAPDAATRAERDTPALADHVRPDEGSTPAPLTMDEPVFDIVEDGPPALSIGGVFAAARMLAARYGMPVVTHAGTPITGHLPAAHTPPDEAPAPPVLTDPYPLAVPYPQSFVRMTFGDKPGPGAEPDDAPEDEPADPLDVPDPATLARETTRSPFARVTPAAVSRALAEPTPDWSDVVPAPAPGSAYATRPETPDETPTAPIAGPGEPQLDALEEAAERLAAELVGDEPDPYAGPCDVPEPANGPCIITRLYVAVRDPDNPLATRLTYPAGEAPIGPFPTYDAANAYADRVTSEAPGIAAAGPAEHYAWHIEPLDAGDLDAAEPEPEPEDPGMLAAGDLATATEALLTVIDGPPDHAELDRAISHARRALARVDEHYGWQDEACPDDACCPEGADEHDDEPTTGTPLPNAYADLLGTALGTLVGTLAETLAETLLDVLAPPADEPDEPAADDTPEDGPCYGGGEWPVEDLLAARNTLVGWARQTGAIAPGETLVIDVRPVPRLTDRERGVFGLPPRSVVTIHLPPAADDAPGETPAEPEPAATDDTPPMTGDDDPTTALDALHARADRWHANNLAGHLRYALDHPGVLRALPPGRRFAATQDLTAWESLHAMRESTDAPELAPGDLSRMSVEAMVNRSAQRAGARP